MRNGSEVHHADDLFRRTSPDLFPLHLATYRHFGALLDTVGYCSLTFRDLDAREAMRKLVLQLEELSPEMWSDLSKDDAISGDFSTSYSRSICTVLYTIAEDCSTKLWTIRNSRIVSFLFRLSLKPSLTYADSDFVSAGKGQRGTPNDSSALLSPRRNR